MGILLSYSIYSAIILALLYLTYKWVLAGENQHRANRAILLSIYAVSLGSISVHEVDTVVGSTVCRNLNCRNGRRRDAGAGRSRHP